MANINGRGSGDIALIDGVSIQSIGLIDGVVLPAASSDPAVLAGALVVYDWISEADTYSNGNVMSSGMTDRTGNGNTAVAVGSPTWLSSGLKTGIPGTNNFSTANCRFTIPSAVRTAMTASGIGEVFVVAKCSTALGNSGGMISFSSNTVANAHHPYGATWYENFGAGTRGSIANPSGINTEAVYRFTRSGSTTTVARNGTVFFNSTLATTSFQHSYIGSSYGAGTKLFTGAVSYVAAFDKALTAGERTTIESYLTTRFSL